MHDGKDKVGEATLETAAAGMNKARSIDPPRRHIAAGGLMTNQVMLAKKVAYSAKTDEGSQDRRAQTDETMLGVNGRDKCAEARIDLSQHGRERRGKTHTSPKCHGPGGHDRMQSKEPALPPSYRDNSTQTRNAGRFKQTAHLTKNVQDEVDGHDHVRGHPILA